MGISYQGNVRRLLICDGRRRTGQTQGSMDERHARDDSGKMELRGFLEARPL